MQLFAQNGVIKELSGTVELKPAGTSDFIPAKAGDPVAKDTIVSTGFKSSALIQMGSSLITARPLTRLSLAELSSSGGTEVINVSLQTGRVRVDVDPPAGTRTSMAVRGPSATASVRGTSFEFDTYSLNVLKGKVAFYPNSVDTDNRLNAHISQAAESSDGGDSSDNVQSGDSGNSDQGSTGTESGTSPARLPKPGLLGDRVAIVPAGTASEISASGRIADTAKPVRVVELTPGIKLDIDTGIIRAVSTQDTITIPKTTLKPASITITYVLK